MGSVQPSHRDCLRDGCPNAGSEAVLLAMGGPLGTWGYLCPEHRTAALAAGHPLDRMTRRPLRPAAGPASAATPNPTSSAEVETASAPAPKAAPTASKEATVPSPAGSRAPEGFASWKAFVVSFIAEHPWCTWSEIKAGTKPWSDKGHASSMLAGWVADGDLIRISGTRGRTRYAVDGTPEPSSDPAEPPVVVEAEPEVVAPPEAGMDIETLPPAEIRSAGQKIADALRREAAEAELESIRLYERADELVQIVKAKLSAAVHVEGVVLRGAP